MQPSLDEIERALHRAREVLELLKVLNETTRHGPPPLRDAADTMLTESFRLRRLVSTWASLTRAVERKAPRAY